MKTSKIATLFAAGLLLIGGQMAMASGNGENERGENGERGERSERGESSSSSSHRGRGGDVAPVDNAKYAKECGSCHFAYQPGLLPERSWRKLMEGLNDHFGENAELPDADRQELTDYVTKHASDYATHRRSVQMHKSLAKGDAPLRISKVPFFVKEHREVMGKIKGSTKVKSISQCEVCHKRAIDGSYAEGEIDIPGIGRWED